MNVRMEHDFLGQREVPKEAYYGIQTLRACENFADISGVQLQRYPIFIQSLAMVKCAAARANYALGLLPEPICRAIEQACDEIVQGKFHEQFIVDMIQGGAGTSTNMNANEVIANRALELLGHAKGDYQYCHPNNHVNLSQSTNDAYPTALRITLYKHNIQLLSDLKVLIAAFCKKAGEFCSVLKMGRTQLQDAVPMTLGQEFESTAVTLEEEIGRLEQMARLFLEINMGATAIGTGINAEPAYREQCVLELRKLCDIPLQSSSNLMEATRDTGSYIIYSSALKRLAVKTSTICNDLRLLSSGPRCGLNEINLPAAQPGSSIMPGKVNPVIPELVNQICFKVVGNDLTVTEAASAGQLQLNAMVPVIAQCIFESVRMLERAFITLAERCVLGITANKEHCHKMVENSIGIITPLVRVLGYERSAAIAQEAMHSQKSVMELVRKYGLIEDEELEQLLRPENMLVPHGPFHSA